MSIIRDHARVGTCTKSMTARFCLLALSFLLVGSLAQAANPVPGQAFLLTPADGATFDKLNPPQLSWSQGQPSAEYFYIYINKDNAHYIDFWQAANDFSATNFWTTNMPMGTYTWWVRTWSSGGWGPWSLSRTFTVQGAAGRITCISPQGTTESTPSITYAWFVPDTYTVWYELLIQKNGANYSDTWHHVSPGDLEISDGGQLGELSLTLNKQPSGVYSWKVRGWSPDGMGAWSSTMTFTNRLTPAGTVTLMSPANGQVVSNGLPQCSWQRNGGSICYWLWLYRNGSVYCSEWLDGVSAWTPTNNLPVGDYTWWLAPWNPDGYGTWASGTFKVPLRVPGNISLLAPSGMMCDNLPMPYSWTADPNTAWYQFMVLKGSATLVNTWLAPSASISTDPSQFVTSVTNQHGAGSYSWWVRGWSADGLGPWSSKTFTIYGQNSILPLAGSTWAGHFSALASSTSVKTHLLNSLVFNTNGTFTGSGTYQVLTLPNTITSTNETFSGTYSVDNGTITANGNVYWNEVSQGPFTFTFSFDYTGQHITSGVWMDTWDSNQEFDITPDSGSPYVSYITRSCGTQ